MLIYLKSVATKAYWNQLTHHHSSELTMNIETKKILFSEKHMDKKTVLPEKKYIIGHQEKSHDKQATESTRIKYFSVTTLLMDW